MERLPDLRPRNTRFDGRFQVPTFAEVVALAQHESRRRRRIGVYPETKHPTYFRDLGLALEGPLLRELRRVGCDRRGAPVFIQSSEITNLRRLGHRTRVRLVQLIGGSGAPYDVVTDGGDTTYADMVTPRGLRRVARYASGIGPDKGRLIPLLPDGSLEEPTGVVDDAHAGRLLVHPYTFRSENAFLPDDFDRGADPAAHGDAVGELLTYFDLGVDGVFGDFPNTVNEARWLWRETQRESQGGAA